MKVRDVVNVIRDILAVVISWYMVPIGLFYASLFFGILQYESNFIAAIGFIAYALINIAAYYSLRVCLAAFQYTTLPSLIFDGFFIYRTIKFLLELLRANGSLLIFYFAYITLIIVILIDVFAWFRDRTSTPDLEVATMNKLQTGQITEGEFVISIAKIRKGDRTKAIMGLLGFGLIYLFSLYIENLAM